MAESGAIRRCRPLLGTFVEIATPPGHDAAVVEAFSAIARVHARMSFHEESSDVARLRRAHVGTAVEVDADTIEVLALARQLHARSQAVFDVAIGARLVASGFLPRPPGIDLRRMTGTTADIEILDAHRVICHRPLLIDLGGIAKGHAVDRAIQTLQHAGVEHAVVNAGGDVRVIGRESVYLRGADGAIDGHVELADAALASSSNLHSRRRSHGRDNVPHLDALRRPVAIDTAVSVIAPRCILADAMTKIVIAAPVLANEMLLEFGAALAPRMRIEQAA